MIQPFFLGSGVLRGTLVRAGRVTSDIMGKHDYPEPVGRLLGECVTLAIALSSSLKYEGLFTLQVRTEGPVRALVVDVTSAGMVRAVARFDEEAIPDLPSCSLPALTGEGVLTFTVDQGPGMSPYQGIVSLEGESVTECALTYITRSEQIPTRLILASAPPDSPSGTWRSAALLLQRMPPATGTWEPEWDDSWETASILMDTLTEKELTDLSLDPRVLLYRLFHAEDLHPGATRPVFYGCRCSTEKVMRTLAALGEEDRNALRDLGVIDVVCEFCQTHHAISHEQLESWLASLET
nr:Hsp33 family molecular chaperone HslO [Phaeovibrio sulfidiphilus]